MATDWGARMVRWSNGIKLDIATKEDLEEYTTTKCYEYTERKINDDNLWEVYKYDFEGFTTEIIRTMHIQYQQQLRGMLQCGGVFVANRSNGVTVAQILFNVLTEEE
jgi:hypothetical protein